MTESATILIPDISGFTTFVARTELEHSAHIVTELLDVLAAANTTGLTLSEVEGDALLLYRKEGRRRDCARATTVGRFSVRGDRRTDGLHWPCHEARARWNAPR